MAIGIALMGAGIFAQEQHLPAIAACPLLDLKAVYSRSQTTCEAFAAKAAATGATVETYFDEPAVDGHSLDDLLARSDVGAVSICMPIVLQPAAIRAVLAAGKHVISEKPVAETVATARRLVAEYRALAQPAPLWAVAENYRFHASLQAAAARVRDMGGALVSFHVAMAKLVRPASRYFNTPWRKVPTHPGGYLLDGGVHYVAALRTLLAAAGSNTAIAQVACFSAQLQELLPPVDTVRAIAITQGGASGVVSVSFGTEFGADLEVAVVTTEGSVCWQPKQVRVARRGPHVDNPVHETLDFTDPARYPAAEASGVRAEFAAFAASLKAGQADPRQSPEEALEDLKVLEALLASGSDDGALRPVA